MLSKRQIESLRNGGSCSIEEGDGDTSVTVKATSLPANLVKLGPPGSNGASSLTTNAPGNVTVTCSDGATRTLAVGPNYVGMPLTNGSPYRTIESVSMGITSLVATYEASDATTPTPSSRAAPLASSPTFRELVDSLPLAAREAIVASLPKPPAPAVRSLGAAEIDDAKRRSQRLTEQHRRQQQRGARGYLQANRVPVYDAETLELARDSGLSPECVKAMRGRP